ALSDSLQEGVAAPERVGWGEVDGFQGLGPEPEWNGIPQCVHQHRSTLAGRQVRQRHTPDGHGHAGDPGDLVRYAFGDAGVRFATGRQRFEDEENVDIGVGSRLPSRLRAEQSGLNEAGGHFVENSNDQVTGRGELRWRESLLEAGGRRSVERTERGALTLPALPTSGRPVRN